MKNYRVTQINAGFVIELETPVSPYRLSPIRIYFSYRTHLHIKFLQSHRSTSDSKKNHERVVSEIRGGQINRVVNDTGFGSTLQ